MPLSATLYLSFGLLLVIKPSFEEPGQRLPKRRYNGLKFGATKQDYILFQQNMTPLQEAYSVCGWVKKIRTDGYPYWFAYGTQDNIHEISSNDKGYFRTLGIDLGLSSKVNTQIGTWRHVCLTWSMSTRTVRVYYDGTEIGSATTPARKLGLEGYIVLGNEFDEYGGGFRDADSFGGEMYRVNVFHKELSSGEVKEMSDRGMCSEIEDRYEGKRHLKWEEMQLKERAGNVTEVDVGCYFPAIIARITG